MQNQGAGVGSIRGRYGKEAAGSPAFSHMPPKPKRPFFLRGTFQKSQLRGKKTTLGDTAHHNLRSPDCHSLHHHFCRGDGNRGQVYRFEESKEASVTGLGVGPSNPLLGA